MRHDGLQFAILGIGGPGTGGSGEGDITQPSDVVGQGGGDGDTACLYTFNEPPGWLPLGISMCSLNMQMCSL